MTEKKTVAIHHYDYVTTSGILKYVPDAWAELIKDGNIDEVTIPVTTSQSALVLKVEGEIVGFITYSRYDREGYLWVFMSYVRPQHRRKGYYRILFDELVSREQERKSPIVQIVSGISATNEKMCAAAEAVGRKPTFIQYTLTLEKKNV